MCVARLVLRMMDLNGSAWFFVVLFNFVFPYNLFYVVNC
jgi:hypothetical protein